MKSAHFVPIRRQTWPDIPEMLPMKFRFIWQSVLRGEEFHESAYQRQELPMGAMFVNESGRFEQFL
jgi:hypothetical protein